MLSQAYLDGDYHLDYLSILETPQEQEQEQEQNGNTMSNNDNDQRMPNP